MDYEVTSQKGEITIKVKVSQPVFNQAYEQMVVKLGAGIQVPGFRQGKAPIHVLEQHIGPGRLLTETANALISQYLGEILIKEKITPISRPKIAIDSLAKDAPFIFQVTVLKKPEVKLGDWKQIRVKRAKAKSITQKDVEESVRNIFEMWKEQQEKAAQKTNEGGKENQASVSGTGRFIYDAYGNKIYIKDDNKPAGKSKWSINDEFAQAIGAKDLAHLNDLVRSDLEAVLKEQIDAKLEAEIFDKILAISTVEAPDSLVEEELNRLLARLSSQLARQGKKLEDFLNEEKMSLDDLKTKWRPIAEKNVKITLILNEIGQAENVQVASDEVEKVLKELGKDTAPAEEKAAIGELVAVSIFQAKTLELIKNIISS